MRLSLQAVIISGGATTLQAVLRQPAALVAKTPPARRAAHAPAALPSASPQVRTRHGCLKADVTLLVHRSRKLDGLV